MPWQRKKKKKKKEKKEERRKIRSSIRSFPREILKLAEPFLILFFQIERSFGRVAFHRERDNSRWTPPLLKSFHRCWNFLSLFSPSLSLFFFHQPGEFSFPSSNIELSICDFESYSTRGCANFPRRSENNKRKKVGENVENSFGPPLPPPSHPCVTFDKKWTRNLQSLRGFRVHASHLEQRSAWSN